MRKLDKKIPKKLQKSLSDVICRIKSQAPNLHIASSTSKLFNGCRHPRSFHLYSSGHHLRRKESNLNEHPESESAASESPAEIGRIDNSAEATLEDIDRFLLENFRSLYCEEEEEEGSETPASFDTSDRSFETPDLTPGEVCDSRRFFVSPSSSSSLKSDPAKSVPSEDCVAVLKASADPCEDFRRSMEEVMEARVRHGEKVDWGFMEELLFSYLRLNEKKHYRFVLDAFVDSVVDMRRKAGDRGGADGGGAAEEVVVHTKTWMKKGKEIKEDIDKLI